MRFDTRKAYFPQLIIVSLFSMIWLCNGCVSQPPVPQDYFYRLPELHPDKPLDHPIVKSTLGVAQLQAEGVYRERPLLYVDAQKPLELLQYHYRHWTQVPTQMIQDSVLDFLRESRVAEQVVRYEPGIKADLLIHGRLMRFERIENGGQVQVIAELEIEYKKSLLSGFKSTVKTYNTKIIAKGETIHDSVQAFGDALTKIYNSMLMDLEVFAREPE